MTTHFTYNTTGSLVEKSDSTGRHSVNHYEDAFSDGHDRRTLAFITSGTGNDSPITSQFDFATDRAVQVQRGAETHRFDYDAAAG